MEVVRERKKIISYLMIFLLVATSFLGVFANPEKSHAASVTINVNGNYDLGSKGKVGRFTDNNGYKLFCAEHYSPNPEDGTVMDTEEYTDSRCAKVLYYGAGGPEEWSGFKNERDAVVSTSLLLSYYYDDNSVKPQDYDGIESFTSFKKFVESKDNSSAGTKVILHKKANVQDLMRCAIQEIPVSINLNKTSANPDITNGNSCYSLVGAKYGVYVKGSLVATLTTNASGKASTTIKLSPADAKSIKIKEISPSPGYGLDNKDYVVNGSSGSVTVNSKEPPQNDPAGMLLGKIDKEINANKPQGSASLGNAEFTVKYYKGLYDNLEALKGENAERSWTFKTDEDGFSYLDEEFLIAGDKPYYSTDGLFTLPLGTITIQETKAPEGYFLNDEIFIRQITSEGDVETVRTYNEPKIPEQVFKHKAHIFKAGIKEVNGVIPGFAGAEFTIKLAQDVEAALEAGYSYEEIWNGINKSGDKVDTDAERIAEAQKIAPTYEVVTTDKDGHAYTDLLPYGKYMAKETVTPKDYYTAEDFYFIIDEDYTEVEYDYKDVYVNNEQMESQIKLVKKDADTGKTVVLDSATFKVKAAEDIKDRATGKVIYAKGEYIKQKVGGAWIEAFTTDKKGIVGSLFGEPGAVMMPLALPVGIYEVEEIKIPEGFLQLDAPIKFNVENIRDNEVDEDGDFVQTVEVKNAQPKGRVEITKNIKNIEGADTNLIKDLDMTGIEFTIYAAKDIIDKADGEVVYKAGHKVETKALDENGKTSFENLWVGNYYIQETKTLPQLIPNDKKYEFEITKKDDTTKIIEVYEEVVNVPTKTSLTKTDATTGKEVEGATVQVIDPKTGNIVDEWVSTKEPHVIVGLEHGKEYIFKETIPPRTYELCEQEIRFTVGSDTKVEMKDEPIKISGQIDKRQTYFGEGKEYKYSIDYRSTSSTWADEYNMIDTIDCAIAGYANVTQIKTPVSFEDWDGKMNVWYKTNKTPKNYKEDADKYNACTTNPENPWNPDNKRITDYIGWKIWKSDVSTLKSETLKVSDLKLGKGEYITGIAFEHGRVEKGFTTRLSNWDRKNLKDTDDIVKVGDIVSKHNAKFDLSKAKGPTKANKKVNYEPAVLYMSVVNEKAATQLKPFWNSAQINIYRNLDEHPNLEDHDEDKVVQKYPEQDKEVKTGDNNRFLIPIVFLILISAVAALVTFKRKQQ